ncbi:MAG: stage III sporulation protein AB [Christensenellales bacterium]
MKLLLKILQSVLVVIACALIGVLRAQKYQNRCAVIGDMQILARRLRLGSALQGEPLSLLLEPFESQMAPPVSEVIAIFRGLLHANELLIETAWERALTQVLSNGGKRYALDEEDFSQILQLGAFMGQRRQAQQESLKILEDALGQRLTQAMIHKEKGAKLSVRIGFLSGVMLALCIL